MRNKFLTRILGATLGLAMAIGVGVGVATNNKVVPVYADETSVSYSATSGNIFGGTIASVNGTSTGTVQLVDAGETVSYDLVGVCTLKSLKSGKSDYRAFTASGYTQIGSGNANVQLNLTASTIPGDILSVDIFAYGSNHTMTVKVEDTSYYSQALGSSEPENAIHITPNASGELAISFVATSAKALYFKSISVVYASSGSSKANVALSCNNLNFDLNSSTDPALLEVTATSNDATVNGLSYTYEVDDDTVATVDASGYVTPVDIGETELTINFAGDDDYYSASTTISVEVIDSSLSTSSLIFTEACGGSGTADDGAAWIVTSDGVESTFDSTHGIHYGTKNAEVTYLQLASSDLKGDIKRVVVKTRDAQACATVSVSVGGQDFVCSGSATATNSSEDYLFTGNARGEIVVKVDRGESMTTALYVKSVVVMYKKITLSSIELGGIYADEFEQGDAFNHTGMTVTAKYSDNSTEDVTSKAQWSSPDMNTTGSKTVTVTYKGKSAEYTITVNSAVVYTVSGTITNGSLSSTASIKHNAPLNITINADENCNRPVSLEVTMGGNALVLGDDYDYDSSNGAFSIEHVTGDVIIQGTCQKIKGLWADKPYMVSEAVAAIDASTNVSNVYVRGIICQVDSYNGTYSSITYWISDDGTTTNKFEVYSGKDFNNLPFAGVDDVKVGATVIVNGNIKKYNAVYEFDKNNTLVFYSGPTLEATKDGNNITSASLVFTTKVNKALWSTYGDISEFGIMLFKTTKDPAATVKERYEADPNPSNPSNVLVVNAATYGLTLDEVNAQSGNYYSFFVRVNFADNAEYGKTFIAAPYIVVGGQHIFLANVAASVNGLNQ